MLPTIGRIVIYTVPEHTKNSINGNKQDELPAVVVAVWSATTINLKVITDGQNDIWVTSASEGTQPGQWHCPCTLR